MSDVLRWLRNQWDRAAAVALVIVAAVAFLVGWIGISGAALASEQIPYLASGGLFGLLALGVGATLWLSADLRDEWRKLDEISAALAGGDAPSEHDAPDQPAFDEAPHPARHGRNGDASELAGSTGRPQTAP